MPGPQRQPARRAAVHGYGHALVVVMDAANEPGKVSLYFPQRQRRHGQKLTKRLGVNRGPRTIEVADGLRQSVAQSAALPLLAKGQF